MKFKVFLKDPDGVYESITDAVEKSLKESPPTAFDEDLEDIKELRRGSLSKFIREWIQYEEYVYLEFDTETKTARLLRVEELDA